MNILLLLTNSPELNSKLLLLFCLASAVMVVWVFSMIVIVVKNTKKFNKFRKELKIGDRVNYQNSPVVIEDMDDKTVTFKLTVSKEVVFPLYFKS